MIKFAFITQLTKAGDISNLFIFGYLLQLFSHYFYLAISTMHLSLKAILTHDLLFFSILFQPFIHYFKLTVNYSNFLIITFNLLIQSFIHWQTFSKKIQPLFIHNFYLFQ